MDLLRDIIYLAITLILVPVVIPRVLKYINAKIDEIQKNSNIANNNLLNKYIDQAQDAIVTAVTTVSQTYVDSLKASGNFSKEAQEEAKNKAIILANALITEDVGKAIKEVYGDFDIYLDATIERIVSELKK